MEYILALAALIVGLVVGYWRGFNNGLGKNIMFEMAQFPLNVTVHTKDDIMYAYNMITEGFIGQSESMDGLIEVIRSKHPEQTIVFSHESSTVNK
jgi:hypothetical protein